MGFLPDMVLLLEHLMLSNDIAVRQRLWIRGSCQKMQIATGQELKNAYLKVFLYVVLISSD